MPRLFYVTLMPTLLALAVFAATVGSSLADPNLPNIPAHRHFIQNPSGAMTEVGPPLCDNPGNPALQRAFNQFHVNVHNAAEGTTGGAAAPGLHNGRGAEIIARGCNFVPPAR